MRLCSANALTRCTMPLLSQAYRSYAGYSSVDRDQTVFRYEDAIRSGNAQKRIQIDPHKDPASNVSWLGIPHSSKRHSHDRLD